MLRSRVVKLGVLALLLAVPILWLGSGVAPAQEKKSDTKFIGAEGCKKCHSAEKMGNQYGHWQESKHSKAFEILASAKAKEFAAAKGIADPQKADACVKCHVTGHGFTADSFKKSFKREDGVQCESCHGPGADHQKARVMAAEGTPVADGEIIKKPPVETCTGCHNEESPSFKPFNYEERVREIAHPRPGH